MDNTLILDTDRDLLLDRVVELPPERIWHAWTDSAMILKWFTPAPWVTTECEIDLRPGGTFRTLMRGPKGEMMSVTGCYLEIIPNYRLVWTDVLAPGFRPSDRPFFTVAITLDPHPQGTRYLAHAMHRDAETRQRHQEMGFHQGWNTALDQLIAAVKAAPA